MSEPHCFPAPRHVDIAITGRCNLSCRYCFYAGAMAARSDLAAAEWLGFFAALGRLGVMTVCLTGGEVFTRPDIFRLIDGLIANRMRYSLLSNGTLLDATVVNALAEGRRRRRLNQLQISLDGSTAAVHDRSRPRSFELALRGIRLARAAGLPVLVRVTVNRYNVDDLDNIARLLLDEIGLPGFSTNEAYPCGAARDARDSILLTPAQRLQAMAALTELSGRYQGRIHAQAGPLALARELDLIRAARAAGGAGLPGRGRLSSCGGVFSKLAVLHDGTIVPCHNLAELVLGRIGVDDPGAIWQRHPVLAALRRRQAISLNELESCRECGYKGFCAGGCPGGALQAHGDPDTRNPMDCLRILMGQEEPGFAAGPPTFTRVEHEPVYNRRWLPDR